MVQINRNSDQIWAVRAVPFHNFGASMPPNQIGEWQPNWSSSEKDLNRVSLGKISEEEKFIKNRA